MCKTPKEDQIWQSSLNAGQQRHAKESCFSISCLEISGKTGTRSRKEVNFRETSLLSLTADTQIDTW